MSDVAEPEDGHAALAASGGAAPARANRQPRRSGLPPFELVVEAHGPAVLRFCIARSGPQAGEDAFQEAMISALRSYPELRDPGAVRGWLFSIAHRKTIDAGRAEQRRPRPAGAPEEVEVVADRRCHGIAVDPLAGTAWVHVRALPAKQREAVTLRYLADLTNSEIASVMEISPDAVRRNVFEGLRRLRTLVADDPG